MCSLTKGMSGTHPQRTVPADTVADTSPVNRARGSTTSGSFGGLLRQPPTVWETGRILAEKGGIILRIDTVIGDSLGGRSRASAEKGGSGGVHEMRVARHRIGPWHTHGHSKTASAYRHICASCHAGKAAHIAGYALPEIGRRLALGATECRI